MTWLTDVSDTRLLSRQSTIATSSRPDVNSATLRHSLDSVRSSLREGGIVEWQVEAEVLFRHVLDVSRSEFLTQLYGGDISLTDDQSVRLQSLVSRRLSEEPLAYIVGCREFYGLELKVTEHVLVPRQETELLVDITLEHLARSNPFSPTIVDVGTGSGALALAIATHAKTAKIIATDISADALEVARRNATNLGLLAKIEFVHEDMLSPIHGPIDVIVSNPPYIPSGDIAGLAVEVRREPRIALDGGVDGLDPLRNLLAHAKVKLAQGGMLIVELMPEQMNRALKLAAETFGHSVDITSRKDLMGNERALVVKHMTNGKA